MLGLRVSSRSRAPTSSAAIAPGAARTSGSLAFPFLWFLPMTGQGSRRRFPMCPVATCWWCGNSIDSVARVAPATISELESRSVGLRSLTEQIDTTTPGGRLIFHVFGALGNDGHRGYAESCVGCGASRSAVRRCGLILRARFLGWNSV